MTAFCSLVVATMAMASPEPSPDSTYRYEVTLPEAKKPIEIKVKRGEQQVVNVNEEGVEYTSEVTEIPVSAWANMVKAGTTPAHDFVTCNKKICFYGNKGKFTGQTYVTVRVDEKEGKIITTSIYSKSISKLQGKYWNPEISTTTAIQKKELSVGDVLLVFADKKRENVQVKLIAVE